MTGNPNTKYKTWAEIDLGAVHVKKGEGVVFRHLLRFLRIHDVIGERSDLLRIFRSGPQCPEGS